MNHSCVRVCCRMFLIRESQQHAQCFVLELCYKLKARHYLVIAVSPQRKILYNDLILSGNAFKMHLLSVPSRLWLSSSLQCEDGGRKYFTMDDGLTLFIDLLQLVEFHQINKGILPVCLKHPCVCVALWVLRYPRTRPLDLHVKSKVWTPVIRLRRRLVGSADNEQLHDWIMRRSGSKVWRLR